ncbi:hypothetical protein E4K67_14970 [Desulfosporosinus fructosivorans]|uniref:DUF1097 domain-containing protein n=1 Tax=Desulfosporosinus fructosivorans TaxID=2018669 RepID=A0A4Z0R593_9FIRM|nr:hypothetical protein [Desulfosporosinus fructosivorans]TGE37177.1 hypothetical protein E4K67_14970 [Desulfosporosinus fructosivorans]
MGTILTKQKFVTGILLLAIIVVLEWALHHFKLPTWPVFMVMVFVFMSHQDNKEIPKILVGGAFGIYNFVILKAWMGLTASTFGAWESSIAYVCIFVFCIVLFMDALPIVFNNYAFMYFLVTALAASLPNPNIMLWIGCELIGGAVVVVMLMGLTKAIAAIMGATAKNHDIKA